MAEGSASTAKREQGFLDEIATAKEIVVVSANQYGGATTETAYRASENCSHRTKRPPIHSGSMVSFVQMNRQHSACCAHCRTADLPVMCALSDRQFDEARRSNGEESTRRPDSSVAIRWGTGSEDDGCHLKGRPWKRRSTRASRS